MRLEWIEDILAVLDTGSFAAAAERRFLTPSAFTRRIRSVEEMLGCPLFDRNRKPVALLPHVLEMETDLRDAARRFRTLRTRLSDIRGEHRKRLSLCCQHALTTMVSPQLARSLGHDRDVSLRIRSGTRSDCHLMLLRQEVDFGLIYETAEDALQFDPEFFEKTPIGRDAFIPVANLRDHPQIQQAIWARDLPLITYPPDIYLGDVFRIHVQPGLPVETATFSVAETGLTPAVLQFIRQGLGIGWLPRAVAQETLASGELTDLSDTLPSAALNIRLVRTHSGANDLARATWPQLCQQATTLSDQGNARG